METNSAVQECPAVTPSDTQSAPQDNSGDLCGFQFGDVVRGERYADAPGAYGRIVGFYTWGLSRNGWVYAAVKYPGGKVFPERPRQLIRQALPPQTIPARRPTRTLADAVADQLRLTY